MDSAILKGIPLFESLGDDDLKAIASRMTPCEAQKDQVMVHEGEESDCLYVILEGHVKIFLVDETGEEIILNFLGPGEYFGEVSLFGDGHRTASVRAQTPCRFGVLEKKDLVLVMADHPQLGFELIRGTTRRLRELSDNVRSLAVNW